jgi:hypothetical protein
MKSALSIFIDKFMNFWVNFHCLYFHKLKNKLNLTKYAVPINKCVSLFIDINYIPTCFGEKILIMRSFGGEVKPSVPCRRFAACKRSKNRIEKASFRQNYRTSFSPTVLLFVTRSARVVRTWKHLAAKVGTSKGESNDKLPLRTCPEFSVPEPYRSPDWALVPAKTGPRAEYSLINIFRPKVGHLQASRDMTEKSTSLISGTVYFLIS